ncbi:MAG: FkbM family methyltransferase [Planctomycetes bacterium]|nr:FkbM family methyltransferase [Planctomycetota bacterium]
MLTAAIESLARAYSCIAPTGRGAFHVARLARCSRPQNRWRDTFNISTPVSLTLDLDIATYPDLCMAYGLYEIDTARLLRRLLRPGDHFVDAGANVGYFTMLAARRVGPTGRVDAFEPQPDNRARLLAHLQRNGLSDSVRVHAPALSDREGQAVIHAPDDPGHNHGESSLFVSPGVKSRDTAVPTARMDAVLAGASPRLVKMDVEGAEPLVIAGMRGLLAGDRPPMIVMEHNVPSLAAAGFAPDEAVRRLLELQPGYRVYRIGGSLQLIKPELATLAAMPQVNLLFSVEPLR